MSYESKITTWTIINTGYMKVKLLPRLSETLVLHPGKALVPIFDLLKKHLFCKSIKG